MRFWQEFRNPKLKCERVGHKIIVEWRRGYAKPHRSDWDYYRTVMNKIRQERRCCTRCREAGDWKVTEKDSIQSFSAPQSTYDAINKGGYWFEHGRTYYDKDEIALRQIF
jgi:hypothetical protein